MSDQNEPAAQVVDDTVVVPTDDGLQGQGDAAAKPEEVSQETAEEIEAKKVSRFQRQKANYETQLADRNRELEYWKRTAMEGKSPVTSDEEDDKEPVLADFDGQGIDAYIKAHAKYVRKQTIAEARREAVSATSNAKLQETLSTRVEATKKEIKDWQEVIDSSEVAARQDTSEFLIDSPIGPKIAYHLAKHPDEHERINKLSPLRRIAELGKLEDKLSVKTVTPAKKATDAPGKLSTVNGSTVVTTDPGLAARTGGYQAWKAAKAAAK